MFNQVNDYPSWGTVLFSTQTANGLTTQSGADAAVRTQFVSFGNLTNAHDTNQPRAIDDQYPVFAFSKSLCTVGATRTRPFTLLLGHVRDPAINFLGNPVSSLWRRYWPAYESMLAFAYNDAAQGGDARRRAGCRHRQRRDRVWRAALYRPHGARPAPGVRRHRADRRARPVVGGVFAPLTLTLKVTN